MRVYSSNYPFKKVWWESILVFFITHILRGKLISYEESEYKYKKFIYVQYKSHVEDCSYLNCTKYPNRKFKNCIEIFNGNVNSMYELPFFFYKPSIDIYKGSYTDTSVEFTRYTYEVRYFGYTLTNICGDEDYYQSLHLYSDRTDERGYKENKGFYKIVDFFWANKTLKSRHLLDLKGKIIYNCNIGKDSNLEHYDAEEKFRSEKLQKLRLTIIDKYDNTEIICTVHRELSVFVYGNTPFTRLIMRLFKKPVESHCVELSFDKEVGKNKGSYKGGIVGTSFNIELDETFNTSIARRLQKLGCVVLKGETCA